jgi:hypothetical protein
VLWPVNIDDDDDDDEEEEELLGWLTSTTPIVFLAAFKFFFGGTKFHTYCCENFEINWHKFNHFFKTPKLIFFNVKKSRFLYMGEVSK